VPQISRGRGETMGESTGQGRAQKEQKPRILSTLASSRSINFGKKLSPVFGGETKDNWGET